MTGDDGKSGPDPLPEDVRARLRELAARVESERSSLNEAKLMREEEVSSLQVELKRREEAWSEERDSLEKSLSLLKSENEALVRERGNPALLRSKIASLEAELRTVRETTTEEINLLQSDLSHVRAELESKRKQWAEVSAEWQRRVEQLTAAAGQAAERETKLQLMMEAAQTGMKKMELNRGLIEDGHSAAIIALEKRHQEQLNAALGALDEMFSRAGKKNPPPPQK